MIVYFARSIRGRHSKADNFYPLICDYILQAGHILAMSLPVPVGIKSISNTDDFIFKRDTYWIDQSNCMIADISNPSYGVGFEVGYGVYQKKIPIICTAFKGSDISAMANGYFYINYYDSQETLKNVISSSLQNISLGYL